MMGQSDTRWAIVVVRTRSYRFSLRLVSGVGQEEQQRLMLTHVPSMPFIDELCHGKLYV